MDDTDPSSWHLVVPVKGGASAKSRLRSSLDRSDLVAAIAHDTLDVAVGVVGAAQVHVVTSDPDERAHASWLGADVVEDPGGGLDAACLAGVQAATKAGAARVAILLGDHPALTPAELVTALEHGCGLPSFFVPDDAGTGTALLGVVAGPPPRLAFGAGSAAAHEVLGHARLDLDLPGLRHDVDDEASLRHAQHHLVLGRHTTDALARASLAGVQASIHTFDPDGSGSALLDDGRLLTWRPEAFAASGLRHVRPGQRVSLETDGDVVTRVWIVGIGDGETIR